MKRLPRLMLEPSLSLMDSASPCLASKLVRYLERLLKADWPAQAMPADLQESLVGDVVVRVEEQLGKDGGKCA